MPDKILSSYTGVGCTLDKPSTTTHKRLWMITREHVEVGLLSMNGYRDMCVWCVKVKVKGEG